MKRTQLVKNSLGVAVLAMALVGATSTAIAAKPSSISERFIAYGNVLNAQPVYREVTIREPRQQCWTEQEQHIVGYQNRNPNRQRRTHTQSAGNAIVGGLIGGVIGNQLGRGHRSRAGATVAGAIIGSAIGSEANNNGSRHRRFNQRHQSPSIPLYETRDVERCNRVVESRTESQLQHYNVTYQYQGQQFTTQYPRDPGKKIEIQVSVAPIRR